MALGNKIGKTFGSTLIVASLLAACNESNFQSETPTRPLKKSSNAVPVVEDPADVTPDGPVSKLPDSLAQLFPTSVEKEGKFTFSLDLKNTQTSFQLNETTGALNDQRSQINRAVGIESVQQGKPADNITDSKPQVGAKGLADILVVIDDSGSMVEEQKELSTKMNELLKSLKGVEWQIGVITTSVPSNGVCNLRKLIRSTDPNPEADFIQAINAGTKGDGNEQGFKQAKNGLDCKVVNGQSWVRADSTVAVLIVSDEDNCSNAPASCANDATNLNNFITVNLGREINKNAAYFGLFTLPGKTGCVGTDNIIGTSYINFINSKTPAGQFRTVNGSSISNNIGNICDADYTSTLNRISQSIALLLPTQFELTQVPEGKVEVITTPQVSESDFTLNGKTITFTNKNRLPADGTTITVKYASGSIPLIPANTINLRQGIPAEETVVVRQTPNKGTTVTLPSSAYTVDAQNKKVILNAAPPALARIDVDYRIKQDLLTRFKLANVPQANSIRVSVNGVATTAFTFDSAKNEVVLNQAPSDGQSIVISYSFVTGQQLTYALPLAVGARDIKILDGATELNFNQNGSNFTIGAGDFVANKTLVLQYEVPDASDRLFDLPQEPVAGSETLSVASGSCDLNNGIVIAGSKLVANCAVEAKTDFTLTYKFLEVQKVYTINGISDPEKGVFIVSVDGEPTTNYTRVGSSITLNFEPPLDSKVDIRYTFPE